MRCLGLSFPHFEEEEEKQTWAEGAGVSVGTKGTQLCRVLAGRAGQRRGVASSAKHPAGQAMGSAAPGK